MALIVCCLIHHIRGVILRLIETALTKQTPKSYQLLLSTDKIQSQIILNEFEEKNKKQKEGGTVRKTVFSIKVCHHLSC
jgi:hypothetical protein